MICPEAPPIDVLHLKTVEPLVQIINEEAWFTLTPQHYSNLGMNLQDILGLTKQLTIQRNYYKDCIKGYNNESQTKND